MWSSEWVAHLSESTRNDHMVGSLGDKSLRGFKVQTLYIVAWRVKVPYFGVSLLKRKDENEPTFL